MLYVNSSSPSPLVICVTTYCCNAISVRSMAKTASGLTSKPKPTFSSMVLPSALTREIVRLTGLPSGLLIMMKSPARASTLNGKKTCKPLTSITRPERLSAKLLLQKLSEIATTSPIVGIMPSRPVAKLTVVLRKLVFRIQRPRRFASLRRVHPIAVMLVGL